MIEHVANLKKCSGYVRVFALLRRLVSGQKYDIRNKFGYGRENAVIGKRASRQLIGSLQIH